MGSVRDEQVMNEPAKLKQRCVGVKEVLCVGTWVTQNVQSRTLVERVNEQLQESCCLKTVLVYGLWSRLPRSEPHTGVGRLCGEAGSSEPDGRPTFYSATTTILRDPTTLDVRKHTAGIRCSSRLNMSTGPGQAHESHFGPTSERIDIASFLQSAQTEAGCADPQCSTSIRGNAQEEWSTLSAGTKSAIQLECRYVFVSGCLALESGNLASNFSGDRIKDGSSFVFRHNALCAHPKAVYSRFTRRLACYVTCARNHENRVCLLLRRDRF